MNGHYIYVSILGHFVLLVEPLNFSPVHQGEFRYHKSGITREFLITFINHMLYPQ